MTTPTALGKRDLGESDDTVVRAAGHRPALLVRSVSVGQVRHGSTVVRENVLLRPAGKVEQGAVRKEVEAGLRKLDPAFAGQPLVELLLQRVKIADVARRIFALRVIDLRRAPVAGLLLLRQVRSPASP